VTVSVLCLSLDVWANKSIVAGDKTDVAVLWWSRLDDPYADGAQLTGYARKQADPLHADVAADVMLGFC
jgi:hypothetical protein